MIAIEMEVGYVCTLEMISFYVSCDLSNSTNVEILLPRNKHIIVGTLYRAP
jgi:hypothetical protein